LPVEHGLFNLSEVLKTLMNENIYSIFIEGGALTYASFIQQGIADRLYLFMAPKLIGEGLSWTSGLGAKPAEFNHELSRVAVKRFGDDLLITGLFIKVPGPFSWTRDII
jgi:diaminohydroxyphosphoribosylaminopyrimidine deaminase/5-amino-6-(5-phosphoribosylamino)uracil reductase